MSDSKEPDETPPAPPSEAPLEVLPESAPMPGDAPVPAAPAPGEPSQSLVVAPVAGAPAVSPPPPPTPIDYAMPEAKTWLPSPAVVRNLFTIFKMLSIFTVMLCVGYFMLMAMNPKARKWALQGSKPGADGVVHGSGPTPFKALNQVLAMPAQAMGKTDDVVKANNARVGQLNGVIAEEEGKLKGGPSSSSRPVINPFATAPADGAAPAGAAPGAAGTTPGADDERAAQAARMMALAEQASHDQDLPKADAVRATAYQTRPTTVLPPVTLPGGTVIRDASPEDAPPATRAFLYWVVNLNVSGVFPSNPPRLMLNGRLTYERQEVNITLGITFDHLDATTKLLHFKDQSGAVVTRSYN